MTTEEKWKIIHAYRRKSALGVLPFFRCHVDSVELLPKVSPGDEPEPIMVCTGCGVKTRLGLADYETMKRLVDEH